MATWAELQTAAWSISDIFAAHVVLDEWERAGSAKLPPLPGRRGRR